MRNLHDTKFLWFTVSMIICAACVDDYQDYNPPHALDAPAMLVSASGSEQAFLTIPINQYQNKYEAYMGLNAPTQFTVSVIDAPGKVGAVSVEPSVPEFGTVTIDQASVDALKGKEQGEFRFVYTPNPDLEEGDDRPFNIVITITDSQSEELEQTSTLTVASVIGSPCFSRALQPGNYLVTDAVGNFDGGEPYTLQALEDSLNSRIAIAVTEERPGVYTISEVTAGVFPVYYGATESSEIQIDVCGNNFSSRQGHATDDDVTYTVNGTINDDGTVTIQWAYEFSDGSVPPDPAKGSYKLTLIKLGM